MTKEEKNGTIESRVDSNSDNSDGNSGETRPEEVGDKTDFGKEKEDSGQEIDEDAEEGVEIDMSEIQDESESEPEPLTAIPTEKPSGSPPPVASHSAAPPPMPPTPGSGVCEEEIPGSVLLEDALKLSAGERWKYLLRRLKEEELSTPGAKHKAFLEYEAGEILEGRVRDKAEAGKAYARAMKLNPGLFPNLWAIRRILAERGRWDNVIKMLDAEIKLTEDNRRKADVWMEKGRIYESALKHDDSARDAYYKAHELAPEMLDPIMALERILSSEGNIDELVKIVRKHADVSGEPVRKAVILQNLARIMGESDYEDRRALLLEAFPDSDDPESVLWDLRRLAVNEERYEHLYEVMGYRAERAEDEGRIEEAAAYRRQQAGIGYRRLGSAGLAWDALRPCWDAALDDLNLVRADLIVLAWMDKRWKELSELLERNLQGDMSPEDKAALRYERHLALRLAGEHEAAERSLEELMEEHSDFLPVLLTRESAAIEKGDSVAIAEVIAGLRKTLESGSGGGEETKGYRAALLSLEAHLWMEVADDIDSEDRVHGGDAQTGKPQVSEGEPDSDEVETPDSDEDEDADKDRAREIISASDRETLIKKAADCCREALGLGTYGKSAAYLLEEILGRLGEWEELAARLKERSEKVESVEKIGCLEALADICRVYLSKGEDEIWALEKLVESEPDNDFHRLRLVDASARAGEWNRAVRCLEDSAEVAVDTARQADILVFAALLTWFKEKNTQAAKTRLRKAKEAAPDHATAGVMLEDLLIETEDWRALVDFYEVEAARSMDEDEIERLLIQKGEVLELRLGRDKEALAVYEDVSERFPESSSAHLLIARLLRRGSGVAEAGEGEFHSSDGELAAMLERDAENAVDEGDRVELLSLAASFYETVTDPEGIERGDDCLKRAFSLMPSNRVVTEKLVFRSLAGENWAQLCEILEAHLSAIDAQEGDSCTGNMWRREVLEMLAWAQELAIADVGGAMEKWRSLCGGQRADKNSEECPDKPIEEAANMIAWASMRQAVRNKNIVDYRTAAMQLVKDVSHQLEDSFRLRAYIHDAMGGERSELDAQGTESELGRLASFVLGTGDSTGDCSFLEEYSGKVDEAPWLFAAALCLLKQGRPARAAKVIEKVLEKRPDHYAAALVARELARELGDKAALAIGSYTVGSLCADPEASADAFMEAARLFMDSGENAHARQALESVLALQPEHEGAYVMTAELLEAERDWEGLCKLLTHRLSVRKDDFEEAEIFLRRANLQLEKLGSKRKAAEDFHRALRANPSEMRAMTPLAKLYACDGDDEKAEELLQTVCDAEGGRSQKREARLLLAEILEKRRMDPERAGKLLQQAVDDEPETDDREILLAFYVRQRKWEDAEKIFEELEESAESDSEKAMVLRRKARFYRELMASEKKADEILLQARRLSPYDIVIVERLAGSYKRLKAEAALKELLSNALDDNISRISDAPCETGIYRNLSRIRDMAQETGGELFALSVLRLLGDLRGEEKEKLARFEKNLVKKPAGVLEDKVWKDFLCHKAVYKEGVWGLWCAIRDPIHKIYDEDLSNYGVGRSNRLDWKKLAGAGKDIAAAMVSFGVEPENCYLWPKEPAKFKIISSLGGPVVLIGEELSARENGLTSGELYLLGKDIAAARMGVSLLLSREVKEVGRIFEAAASEGYSGFSSEYPASELASVGKSIKKAFGWGNRKALNAPAEVFAKSGESIADWFYGVRQTCIRTGLVLSCDLARACLDGGGLEGSEWSDLEDPSGFVDKHDEVKDVLRFVVSDELLFVRRESGLAEKK